MQYQFWAVQPGRHPGVEPIASLFVFRHLRLDADHPGQLPALRHREGRRHRHGSEYHALVYHHHAPLTAVSVTASRTSPQPVNTPITLTATATGGTNVQYQFWVYNPAATPAWSQLQAYSTPVQPVPGRRPPPANYLLSVTAKDGVTGTEVNTTLWYTITAVSSEQ